MPEEANPNEIELEVTLADFAKVSEGKLDVMGAGWTDWGGGSNVGPMAVVILAKVPASWAGQEITLDVRLVDGDGQFVDHAPNFQVKATSPAGARPGASVTMPLAVNMGPFPLTPNNAYEWRVTVNEDEGTSKRAPFFVHRGTPPHGILRPAS